MSKRIFNIVRPREYNAGDGQMKTIWDRHGVLIVDGKKLSIHLDSVPVGDEWNGWFNVFERENDQQAQTNGQGFQQQAPQYQPSQDGFDDDIPF